MKLSILIDSVLIVASIALLPEIRSAQTATNNSGAISINSNNLLTDSTNVSYLKPFDAAFIAYQGNLKAQGIPSGSAWLNHDSQPHSSSSALPSSTPKGILRLNHATHLPGHE